MEGILIMCPIWGSSPSSNCRFSACQIGQPQFFPTSSRPASISFLVTLILIFLSPLPRAEIENNLLDLQAFPFLLVAELKLLQQTFEIPNLPREPLHLLIIEHHLFPLFTLSQINLRFISSSCNISPVPSN